ncbi:MAG: hypothetical protein IJ848_01410, partial [Alphaproteobacteria bacterium]|nr:hypothetical protein [Alphaproteobacteria bacterium]
KRKKKHKKNKTNKNIINVNTQDNQDAADVSEIIEDKNETLNNNKTDNQVEEKIDISDNINTNKEGISNNNIMNTNKEAEKDISKHDSNKAGKIISHTEQNINMLHVTWLIVNQYINQKIEQITHLNCNNEKIKLPIKLINQYTKADYDKLSKNNNEIMLDVYDKLRNTPNSLLSESISMPTVHLNMNVYEFMIGKIIETQKYNDKVINTNLPFPLLQVQIQKLENLLFSDDKYQRCIRDKIYYTFIYYNECKSPILPNNIFKYLPNNACCWCVSNLMTSKIQTLQKYNDYCTKIIANYSHDSNTNKTNLFKQYFQYIMKIIVNCITNSDSNSTYEKELVNILKNQLLDIHRIICSNSDLNTIKREFIESITNNVNKLMSYVDLICDTDWFFKSQSILNDYNKMIDSFNYETLSLEKINSALAQFSKYR